MNVIKSTLEVYFDDGLGDVVERALLALGHPLPELAEVQLFDRLLLLVQVLPEDLPEVLSVGKDVVEGVGDDHQGDDVVQLVSLLRPRLQDLPKHSKGINGGLSVALLEFVLELSLVYVPVEGSLELLINSKNFV
jgi:hypothetical protein